MSLGLIGKKIGMTQVFRDDGVMEAVTVIEAGPCTVTQIKTSAKEGYDAVQLGYDEARLNRPEKGHLKGLDQFKYLREFRIEDLSSFELGQKVDVSLFKAGERIDVTGLSKGKGFAGVVKRYHFAGGPKTHGQSDRHRAPGAIGAGTSPGRVWKGTHMAGHMGAKRTTVQYLEVVRVDTAQNLLLLRGTVPGAKKGYLLIRKSRKGK
jgi:large subunit ribosomal protein L3